ncbi:MAG: hypothetical protein MMC23_001183 [Stictis urceolatum]|nr:hypothetical protein [Stictis urceolata]
MAHSPPPNLPELHGSAAAPSQDTHGQAQSHSVSGTHGQAQSHFVSGTDSEKINAGNQAAYSTSARHSPAHGGTTNDKPSHGHHTSQHNTSAASNSHCHRSTGKALHNRPDSNEETRQVSAIYRGMDGQHDGGFSSCSGARSNDQTEAPVYAYSMQRWLEEEAKEEYWNDEARKHR